MTASKGYYSIVQYCPDRARLESANIGVLLFCPDRCFLEVRTARNNERIRRFFGSEDHDWKKIDSFKIGVEERVKAEHSSISTVEDLEDFIDRRANRFRLTEPRAVRVTDPEHDIDRLFRELVGGSHRKESRPSMRQRLADVLEQPKLTRKLRRHVPVRVPIDGRDLEIPYAFQNGRFNLIKPVRFHAEDPAQSAYRYAVEGRSIYDANDDRYGPMKLLVVGSFRSNEDESRSLVSNILSENSVGLYSMSELDRLAHEILTTGKDVGSE